MKSKEKKKTTEENKTEAIKKIKPKKIRIGSVNKNITPVKYASLIKTLYSYCYHNPRLIEAYRFNLISLFILLVMDGYDKGIEVLRCDAEEKKLMSGVVLIYDDGKSKCMSSIYSEENFLDMATANNVFDKNVFKKGSYAFVKLNQCNDDNEVLKQLEDFYNVIASVNLATNGREEIERHLRFINTSILYYDYPDTIINLMLYVMFITGDKKKTEITALLDIYTNGLNIVDKNITYEYLKEVLDLIKIEIDGVSRKYENSLDKGLDALLFRIKEAMIEINKKSEYDEYKKYMINFLQGIIYTVNDYLMLTSKTDNDACDVIMDMFFK